MGPAPVQSTVAAVSLIVLANGPLFFLERRVLGLPGVWEGPVMQPTLVLTIGAGVLVCAAMPRRDVALVPLIAATGLGVWAAVSTWWSVQPDVTLWRGVLYIGMPALAWVVASLEPAQLARALGVGAAALIISSLVLVATWSRVGVDHNGDWRGLMTNRNGFAPICGLAVIIALALLARRRRVLGGVVLVGAVVGLLGSGSRTAWFALIIALGVATVAVVARRRDSIAPAAALTAAGVGGVGLGIHRLWNEPTLVQRRTIWDLAIDHAADARWHGVGWEAFWYTPAIHEHELLQRGSAHGSVPELLLGLGIVGLALWLVVVGAALAGVGRAVWREPDVDTWMWAGLVAFLVVENLTESFVMWFSYNWLLLIVAALRFGPGPLTSLGPRNDAPSAAATS